MLRSAVLLGVNSVVLTRASFNCGDLRGLQLTRIGLQHWEGLNGRACHASQGWCEPQRQLNCLAVSNWICIDIDFFNKLVSIGIACNNLNSANANIIRIYEAVFHLADDLPTALRELQELGVCWVPQTEDVRWASWVSWQLSQEHFSHISEIHCFVIFCAGSHMILLYFALKSICQRKKCVKYCKVSNS